MPSLPRVTEGRRCSFSSSAAGTGGAEPSWSPVEKEESWRKPSPTWEVLGWPHPHPAPSPSTRWSAETDCALVPSWSHFYRRQSTFLQANPKDDNWSNSTIFRGSHSSVYCPNNPHYENLEMFRKYVFLKIKIHYFLVLKRKMENCVNQNNKTIILRVWDSHRKVLWNGDNFTYVNLLKWDALEQIFPEHISSWSWLSGCEQPALQWAHPAGKLKTLLP